MRFIPATEALWFPPLRGMATYTKYGIISYFDEPYPDNAARLLKMYSASKSANKNKTDELWSKDDTEKD